MSTGIARFTGMTTHAGTLVTAIALLTGAAILRGGAAVADSNQDEQFLALLDREGIPAVSGVPSLIYTAHKVCRKLDAGMRADDLVDAMVNDAYGIDPPERLYASGRLARTEARFITAAVEAYCPDDQSKIASIMANPAAGWNEPTQRAAPSTHNAVNSGGDLREPPPALDIAHGTVLVSLIGAVPSGENTDPSPPQPPAPPPPAAHVQTAPRPIAAPPRPIQSPLPPQQPPPPPQQPPPPVVDPQPGGAAGSGGGGGNGSGGNGGGSTGGSGGGRPAEPSPEPPMPPGFVTLAP
jgi:uncharacterized membrane protein YgcG